MAKLLAHQMLGVAVAYYVLRPENILQALICGGLALLGSTIPDLDEFTEASGHPTQYIRLHPNWANDISRPKER